MSNTGSMHWLVQRFSAIFLIFLSAFFSYKIFGFIGSNGQIYDIFNEPFTVLVFLLFFIMAFYHASLGIEVIVEDYVSCNANRQFINFVLKCLNIATIGFLLMAVIFGYQKLPFLAEKGKTEIVIQQSE
jgi:succinate dehydrogenase / fumarate reductase membrane anchor subunit